MDVELSQTAAMVVQLLNAGSRALFVKAVQDVETIADVAQPYQRWLRNPDSIPQNARLTA